MRKVKSSLLLVENNESTIGWEYETLTQRFVELKKERDELRANLQACIYDVKQKTSFRSLLLEKKLLAMQRVHEEREAQLNEVLSRANFNSFCFAEILSLIFNNSFFIF